MSDSYGNHQQNERYSNGSRGGSRGGRGRDGGGFRIRLSDNEMKAARSIQEAFQLRSTVAVLGFTLRTLGQMLEEGKLDELIANYKAQAPQERNRNNYREANKGSYQENSTKPNPFARPSKPQETQLEDSDLSIEESIDSKDDENKESGDKPQNDLDTSIETIKEEPSIKDDQS